MTDETPSVRRGSKGSGPGTVRERAASARRVWIVNHYASAPDRPTGSRHFDLARDLQARGYSVTIFAAGFSHATGREERLTRGRLYRSERFDGVEFVWLRTLPYRGNTWRRQANMLSFLAALLVVQTRWPAPMTVVGSTVHPFAAFGAWLAATLRGGRFVFEIRDLWPQTLVDLGALRVGSPGERLLRSLEAFLVRRASAVITLLPGMVDYLRERGLPSDHVVYIPNGVDLAAFAAQAAAATSTPASVRHTLAEIDRMRRDRSVVFGYVGMFGRVNRLDVVVRAAALAEERAPGLVGVILVGDGAEREELERAARGVPSVSIGPPIPKESVPLVLAALDATVVHATATPVYRFGISFNKLFEYMAAARPVAFACDSTYDPVATTGAGASVHPDDPDALADAFVQLASADAQTRAAMGAAGRAYVAREHSISDLGERFAAVIAKAAP